MENQTTKNIMLGENRKRDVKDKWKEIISKNQDISKRWQDFSNSTSLHGIKYTIGDNHGLFRRILWLVILLASLAFLLHEITRTALQYQQHLSLIAIAEQAEAELTLPAVTVCNNNLYRASAVHELYPHLEGTLHTWASMVFGEEPLNVTHFLAQMNDTARSQPFAGLGDTMHWQLSHVYIRCKKGSELLNCSDYTSFKHTDKGPCFTFNDLDMPAKHPLKVNKPGHMTAIMLTLDVQPNEYFLPFNYATGLLISIHDQYERKPFLEDRNIVLPPGRDVYIALQKTKLTRLGKPFSKQNCVTGKYNKRGECITDCKNRNAFECGGQCRNTVSEGPDACTMEQGFECSMVDLPRWYEGEITCDCPLPCDEVIFEHKLSYGAFPNTLALEDARTLNWTHQDAASIADNYVNVNIYYEDLKTIYKRQTPVINQWQLFSSIGGLMGLALGTSFITVLEFFDFACVAIYERVKARREKRNKVRGFTDKKTDSTAFANGKLPNVFI